ncbi:MAG TPA: MFS transporter [Bacteroidales bacterium]|nr:MFS transporter [Bacteroidales bacterium]HPF03369.1 MFS transporter [Bacteroidales bacterium]HPJ58567.1 MFS transporter [Bacteroidales bacterium]HPR11274.1 MFS transporter [Bacteroidales bacterium]HRW86379.1 MFS transporter [Bacteroidales bacterium]
MTQISTDLTSHDLRRSQIFVVITAFLSLLAIVGIALYGLPLFYNFYIDEFGWSRQIVTSGNAYAKIIVAPLFGFIAGWIVDKYGPRKMLMTGALMTLAAFLGLSMMKSLSLFYISYVLVALGYVFGGPLPCQVLISRWFTRNRGKAMGIAYLGIGTGFTIVPQLVAKLESSIGWNMTLVVLGIIIVLVSVPLALFVKDSPSRTDVTIKPEPAVPIKAILTNPWFYFLAFGSMCSIGAVGGINQHLKLYLKDLSMDEASIANIISLVAFMSLAGRVIMGWLADLMPRKYVMILIYLLVGGSIPLLLLPDFPGRLYIFAVIFGIGLGGDYMIIPLMAGDLFGVRTLGRVMGIVLVADGISEAGMPMLVGRMFDISGNYMTGFIVLIGLALFGTLVISFLPKNKIVG